MLGFFWGNLDSIRDKGLKNHFTQKVTNITFRYAENILGAIYKVRTHRGEKEGGCITANAYDNA